MKTTATASPPPLHLARAFATLMLACFASLTSLRAPGSQQLEVLLPAHRLQAEQLGLIVNDQDPLSVQIGDYYRKARGIPARNVLHVSFAPGRPQLSEAAFAQIHADLERDTPPQVQAYAITWAAPFRVECMSITSAISFGFDRTWCSKRRCAPTRHSPYFDSDSTSPWSDYSVRPTMAIAALDFEQARALIDRGVRADNTQPTGTAYLVSTSDKARNVRAAQYETIALHMQNWLDTRIVVSDALQNVRDILFYFTGKAVVPYLDTLEFLPGAVADHLTSAGGKLTGSAQMSALRWLEAGATGSYGTVVEPCNVLGKFPNPRILIEAYTHGSTLLEAYWKSVQQPGEGIFVGEPLAAPWDGYSLAVEHGRTLLNTRTLRAGNYSVEVSVGAAGPFRPLADPLNVTYHQQRFLVPRDASRGFLRLQRR
jgi:uncharacterized protein (TIGR03790 family)